MPIEPGDTVPPATLKQMTPDGIKDVDLRSLLSGKKVILFGLPGAYTPVCSTAHLPGFIAEADRLKNEGVAENRLCRGERSIRHVRVGKGERCHRESIDVVRPRCIIHAQPWFVA